MISAVNSTQQYPLDFAQQLSNEIRLIQNSSTEENSSFDEELNLYISESVIPIKEDVLNWWFDHKNKFPRLFELSIKYLIVQATSTPSERVFSTAGYVLSTKRSRLTEENLDMLLFMYKKL